MGKQIRQSSEMGRISRFSNASAREDMLFGKLRGSGAILRTALPGGCCSVLNGLNLLDSTSARKKKRKLATGAQTFVVSQTEALTHLPLRHRRNACVQGRGWNRLRW